MSKQGHEHHEHHEHHKHHGDHEHHHGDHHHHKSPEHHHHDANVGARHHESVDSVDEANSADMISFGLGDRLITKRLIFDKMKSAKCDTSDDDHYHDESDDSDYNSNEEFHSQRRKTLEASRAKVNERRKKKQRLSMKKVGTQRFRNLLQGSKNPIELIVPSTAIRWRNILYMFSRILCGFGLGIFVFGIWVLASPTDNRQRVLPHWTAGIILAFGGSSFVFGVLAWRGSDVSLEKLRHGRRNLWLWALNTVLTFMILFFMGSIILMFAMDSSWMNTALESMLLDDVKLDDKTGKPMNTNGVRTWYDMQQFLVCCGWSQGTHVLGKGTDITKDPKSHSMLATGKWCTSQEATTGQPCLDALTEYALSKGWVMLVIIGVFIAVQLTVLVASICLSYIIKAHTPFMNI